MSEKFFHENKDRYLVIAEVLILCAKSHNKFLTAALLGEFGRWTVEALESGQDVWVTKSIEEMSALFDHYFKRRYIAKMLAWLIKQQFILRRNNPDETNSTPQYLLNVERIQNFIDEIEIAAELAQEAGWDYDE